MNWLRRSTVVFAILSYLLIAVATPMAERRLFGVPPGVTLAGVQIGGWLPREVNGLMGRMARTVDRPARPAVLNKLTGRVVPGRAGQRLDRRATAARVRSAAAGASVRPVVRVVPPAVTAAELSGPGTAVARVAAPPGAAALGNIVVLPDHPFVFVAPCSVGAALRRAADLAGLPARRLRPDCRVELRNPWPNPLVLRVTGGSLEIVRYGPSPSPGPDGEVPGSAAP